ncbi:MAG: DUF2203 domain-containing protein [Thermoplasmata archaeon]|nr:DUF2203 domain-containing protein [Thermoplasmata archaeon]
MARTDPPPDPSEVDPPRLWTVEEANARIGDLEELLPRLRAWTVRLGEVQAELRRLSEFWGKEIDAPDQADHERKSQLDSEWANLTQRLEEAVDSLRREAIELKDVDSGLVDFYGYIGGEVVYLCWLRGEPEVGHFHTLTGGFRARRPLPTARRAAPTRAGETG